MQEMSKISGIANTFLYYLSKCQRYVEINLSRSLSILSTNKSYLADLNCLTNYLKSYSAYFDKKFPLF